MSNKGSAFEADELIALSRVDIGKGDLEKALSKLKQAISMKNYPVEALAMTARLYAQIGLFDRAKTYFSQYLNQVPGAVNESFQYGMVHLDSGDSDAALAAWEELLAKRPEHPPAQFYTGLIKAEKQLLDEAKETLESLINSIPADNLYFGRAKDLLQAIERGDTIKSNAQKNAEKQYASQDSPYETEH
jgi:tetratricopeptide (TPR) repeat protein